MRGKLIWLFLLILVHNEIFGQSEVESANVKIVERSPSAPNTSSLGKYFDIPVNMATGIPSIKIPIYTIRAGNLVFPISLVYHSTGIKVNDPASWVGFGWDLECGGVVTKQVNGLDDFYAMVQYPEPPGWPTVTPHSNYFNPDYTIDHNLGFTSMTQVIEAMFSDYTNIPGNLDKLHRLLGRINQSKYDGESDEYHYSTPTGSGSIFYNQDQGKFRHNEINGTSLSYVDNNGWYLNQKDGIGYSFTAREESGSPFYETVTPAYPSQYFVSAWYMTAAGDALTDKGVAIEYDYSSIFQAGNGSSQTESWTTSPPSYAAGSSQNHYRWGNQLNVKTVTFSEGKIEFIKDPNPRLDGGINALKTIKIFDKNNVLCKQFELTYFYAWSGYSTRMFLQSVQEVNYINGSTAQSRPYVMSYNTNNNVMPPRFSFAQDIWGYNNGKTNNSTNIPTEAELMGYGVGPFADRSIDAAYTQTGIITKIDYPTGGNINFEFENNRDHTNALVGGLRVKKITNYDPVASKNLITEYRYNDDNGNSTGLMEHKPEFHYWADIGNIGITQVRMSGTSRLPLLSNQGSPVTYGRVEKVEIGNGTELKSRYYYANDLAVVNIPLMSHQNPIGVPFNKYSNLQRFKNLLYKTEILKKVGVQYQLFKKEEISYGTLNNFDDYIWNVQAAWSMGWGTFCEWAGHDPYATGNPVTGSPPMYPFPSINAYKLFSESLITTNSTSETYDANGNIISQSLSREYDQTNGNLKLTTTELSNGDFLRTRFRYVSDLNYTSSSNSDNIAINQLIDYNLTGLPIEIIKTIQKPGQSETVVDATLYTYENRRIKKIRKYFETVPLSTFQQCSNDVNGFYFDPAYEIESEVEAFDASYNPIQVKLKDKTQAIIWDGDNVMASVINANVSDIAATSFESTNKGQFTFYGSTISALNSPAGNRGYSLNGYPISKTGLNNALTYTVSYWSNSGSYQVNGSTGVPGRTIDGWTNYEHTVSPNAGEITINGTGPIDEVRLYPAGTFMTTYSYFPLIGMSYVCDINNKMQYYEYDGLGRLVLIKDLDKKVVKKICYNFAGQVENCTHNCTNLNPVWQSTSTPVRCQQGPCANTGYQEQEQIDVNPCSPTYNQVQWVNIGYNPSVCPTSGNVSLISHNVNNLVGFTATYSNNVTGQDYSFSVPAFGQTMGCIPAGSYALTISKPGNNIWLLFGTGCQSTSGMSASFPKVLVSSSACNQLLIDWDF